MSLKSIAISTAILEAKNNVAYLTKYAVLIPFAKLSVVIGWPRAPVYQSQYVGHRMLLVCTWLDVYQTIQGAASQNS